MFTPFRRTRGGVAHVFNIQWDKYGKPRFVVNFGEASSDGVTFGNRLVSAEELEPPHCPLSGRLQRWRGGSLRTWFQLSKPWSEKLLTLQWAYSPEEVATQLISGFEELEMWWHNKREGPHIYIWRSNPGL